MVGLLYRVIVTEKTRIKSNFTEKIISRLYLVTNIRSEMAVVAGVNETAFQLKRTWACKSSLLTLDKTEPMFYDLQAIDKQTKTDKSCFKICVCDSRHS